MTRELVKRVDEFTHSILMDAEDYGTCEGLTAKTVLEELGDILPKGLREELVAEIYKEALKDYAHVLWNHRDDKYGHDVDDENGGYWNICKGSDLIELDSQNLSADEIYPYDPDGYYLSRNSIEVYKVGSAEDIEKVLDGNGDEFFEFC